MKGTSSAVGIVLVNSGGGFLLQHRDSEAVKGADMWGLFGGRVEEDETPEQAITREVQEEIGLEIGRPTLLHSILEDGRWWYCFLAFIDESIEKIRELQVEGDDARFFTIGEIKELPVLKKEWVLVVVKKATYLLKT